MGNFTIKTDSYLNQFSLFKSVDKLLKEGYKDTPIDIIPSQSQLLSDKLYHEWVELAEIVTDINSWTESNWKNFNICMSMAELSKNNIDSISYALQGLGFNFDKNNQNIVETFKDKVSITIQVNELNSSPRIDQIKSKLKRCIEYLYLAKNPELKFEINVVNISESFESGSESTEILATKSGILYEAETFEYSINILIEVQDTLGSNIDEIFSYMDPSSGSGYTKYLVKIKDEEHGTYINNPEMYQIESKYNIINDNFKVGTIKIPTTGWVEDPEPIGGGWELPTYYLEYDSNLIDFDLSKDIVVTMSPASSQDELESSKYQLFLSFIDRTENKLYFRCKSIPQSEISVNIFSYVESEYESMNKTSVILSGGWDIKSNTISCEVPGLIDGNYTIVGTEVEEENAVRICTEHEIYIESIESNKLIFKCSSIPTETVEIPIRWINLIDGYYKLAPDVSKENPIPSAYFDKDKMILWIAKGQGEMDHSNIEVLFTANHIYSPDKVETKLIPIKWREQA